jgi:hypothetical protein
MKSQIEFDDLLLGALFAGLGQMVLFLGVPKFYVLLSAKIDNPGTGLAINDFPIEPIRPVIQWLIDTVGAFGMSFLLASLGMSVVAVGWR